MEEFWESIGIVPIQHVIVNVVSNPMSQKTSTLRGRKSTSSFVHRYSAILVYSRATVVSPSVLICKEEPREAAGAGIGSMRSLLSCFLAALHHAHHSAQTNVLNISI